MTTIFTDDFSQCGVDIDIEDESLGFDGRTVTFTTSDEGREFRVVLPDDALQDLADQLALRGFIAQAIPND